MNSLVSSNKTKKFGSTNFLVARDAAAGLENLDLDISQFIVVVINSTKSA